MIGFLTCLALVQAATAPSGADVPPASDTLKTTFLVGGYTPNAELLAECTSKEPVDIKTCDGFIKGVAEASEFSTVRFPNGPIAIPTDTDYNGRFVEPRNAVIAYLNDLPATNMVYPAALSVYIALSARYPSRHGGRDISPGKGR